MLLGPAITTQPQVVLTAPWAPVATYRRDTVAENPLVPDQAAAGLVESLSCSTGSRLYLPVVVRGGAGALAPAVQSGPAAPKVAGAAAPSFSLEPVPIALMGCTAHQLLRNGDQHADR